MKRFKHQDRVLLLHITLNHKPARTPKYEECLICNCSSSGLNLRGFTRAMTDDE